MLEKSEGIIEALKRVVLRKGYSKTSIEDITTEAGISKGSFYTYFKNKDEVLNAIIKRKSQAIGEKNEMLLKEKLSLEKTIEKILSWRIKGRDEYLKMEMAAINIMQNIDTLGEETKRLLIKENESRVTHIQNILIKYGDEINLQVKDIKRCAKVINGFIDKYKIEELFIEIDENKSLSFVNDVEKLRKKIKCKKTDEDLKFLKETILKILK